MTKKPSDILKDYAKSVEMVDPSKFDFLLQEIPRIIRVRTRLGKGLLGKLKELSPKYIDARKKDKSLYNETTPRIIRVRTRLGKGLLGKLKELSPKYIDARKKDKSLYNETTPKKSNLTRTGEMLNSIIGTRSGTLFTFFFSNTDSNKKAYWADQTGRPFFDLTPSERNGLQRKISAIIRDTIRQLFKS